MVEGCRKFLKATSVSSICFPLSSAKKYTG